MDAQTFLIPNFTYNGQVTLKMDLLREMKICFEQAPDAHFWVGEGSRPGPEVTICLYICIYPSIPSIHSIWLVKLSIKQFHSAILSFYVFSPHSAMMIYPYKDLFIHIHNVFQPILLFKLPVFLLSIHFKSSQSVDFTHSNVQGTFVADENGSNEPLRKYSQKTLVIVLPGDLTVFDIGEQQYIYGDENDLR